MKKHYPTNATRDLAIVDVAPLQSVLSFTRWFKITTIQKLFFMLKNILPVI